MCRKRETKGNRAISFREWEKRSGRGAIFRATRVTPAGLKRIVTGIFPPPTVDIQKRKVVDDKVTRRGPPVSDGCMLSHTRVHSYEQTQNEKEKKKKKKWEHQLSQHLGSSFLRRSCRGIEAESIM